jgi:hypothetical protein
MYDGIYSIRNFSLRLLALLLIVVLACSFEVLCHGENVEKESEFKFSHD